LIDKDKYAILIKATVQGGSLLTSKKGGDAMDYVTWQDLILLGTMIIALLAYLDDRNNKRKK